MNTNVSKLNSKCQVRTILEINGGNTSFEKIQSYLSAKTYIRNLIAQDYAFDDDGMEDEWSNIVEDLESDSYGEYYCRAKDIRFTIEWDGLD